MTSALRAAREALNRAEILFDRSFAEDMDRYFEIYRQMNALAVVDWHLYRLWIANITNNFDAVYRNRIACLEGRAVKNRRLILAPISYEERVEMTPESYLEAHRKHWERRQK